MQDTRHPQQQAVTRLQAVFIAQFVEQPHGQFRHVLGVGLVVVEFQPDAPGGPQRAGGYLRVLLAGQVPRQVQHQAIPHGHPADHHGVGLHGLQQLQIHDQRRHQRLGDGVGKAVELRQVLGRAGSALFDQFLQPVLRHPLQGALAAGLPDLLGREPRVAAYGQECPGLFQTECPFSQVHGPAGVLAQQVRRARGRLAGGGQRLLHAYRADVVALAGPDLPAAQNGQQRAAAADLRDQADAVQVQRPAYVLQHRQHDQPHLLGGLDDLHVQVNGAGDPVQEGVHVARFPHGAGGHGSDGLHPVGVQHAAVVAQHGDGGVHGLLAQPPVHEGVLPQPHAPPGPLQYLRLAVRAHLGDLDTHLVRADVNHPDRRTLRRGFGAAQSSSSR